VLHAAAGSFEWKFNLFNWSIDDTEDGVVEEVKRNQIELVQILLNEGADLNTPAAYAGGRTAL
jgi:hypothetical protein